MSNDPWYKKGLNFSCQGCGKCCFGFPGYVWLSSPDIKKISKHLNLTPANFLDKYTRNVYGAYSLKEMKAPTYECIFFENKKCKIYSVRPLQCRSYPFWPHHLTSKEIWEKNVKSFCPGTQAKTSLSHSKKEIDLILEEYKKELPF
jgi:uncharacterized protein